MIATLVQLGEQLSADADEWKDIIDIPKVDDKKENLIANLIFDLDRNVIEAKIAGVYGEKSPLQYKNISIKGGNNKATYICCETDKVAQIEKTLFGKIDNKGKAPVKGEFQEYIDNKFKELSASQLYGVLQSVYMLRDQFLAESWNDPATINCKLLGEDYKKPSNKSKLVLVYVSVVSTNNGVNGEMPIGNLDGFDAFIQQDRFTKPVSESLKISYATGEKKENVSGVSFPNRYSLNYMFVETTLNYAAGFDKGNFKKNYQLNSEEQLFLERASERILRTQKITIAGVPHCIIPQFINSSTIDFSVILEETYQQSELLFQQDLFESSMLSIKDEIRAKEVYWLNFLAYESDGNSFKTISLIKDVCSLQFNAVIQAFKYVDDQFKTMDFVVNWSNVMSDIRNKERNVFPFNLQTIYQLIPQRKDKEKKNESLGLFKSILEQRLIDQQILFKQFSLLILCHRFGRYEAYKNVKRFGDEYFDFAIQDAVFKYLAFFKVLHHLKLFKKMDENNQFENADIVQIEETASMAEYAERIDLFFSTMQYTDSQKALFYLGRMLSSVAYIQKDKKKTVLDKLNFNGMEKNDIQRLRISLIEKAKQYQEIGKVIFNDARFNDYFTPNNWVVNPHEALFFILSGYSFGISKSTKH